MAIVVAVSAVPWSYKSYITGVSWTYQMHSRVLSFCFLKLYIHITPCTVNRSCLEHTMFTLACIYNGSCEHTMFTWGCACWIAILVWLHLQLCLRDLISWCDHMYISAQFGWVMPDNISRRVMWTYYVHISSCLRRVMWTYYVHMRLLVLACHILPVSLCVDLLSLCVHLISQHTSADLCRQYITTGHVNILCSH